jgi:hypothetical protein
LTCHGLAARGQPGELRQCLAVGSASEQVRRHRGPRIAAEQPEPVHRRNHQQIL